ncbi:hypothetical protein COLO4_35763 [Corchorus olitorius]|uniref:Dehydrogenase E1 component domain-containing protein n=1 Tax=Corchorus olitorius TaxID=93759 RepID=A0A1R3GDR3_9ROSI|nr:hypothetical protein COLO4_35763 [Corchorus olitorius]
MVKTVSSMVTLQTMDTIFYEAQRQGRISFYVTTIGEEAINIASAAALSSEDFVFPQGYYKDSPLFFSTQIPHAVGAAYSLKMDKKNACAVTYFGDGGTSEGDFHAALNFAAVTEAPVIFICRNNGWAISTPTSDQFRSDGIAVRGQAYGVRSIRVDGNDALAMYSAVHTARKMAVNEHRPILIEAVTYRVGHHSTSDDSTKYRPADEIEWWKMARDPVTRFRKWIESNGWWNNEAESELRSNIRNQLLLAIQVAEKVEKPPVIDLFTDVYDDLPTNLREQEILLRETINKHRQDYPADVPF